MSYRDNLPRPASRLAHLQLRPDRAAVVLVDLQRLDADRACGVGPELLATDTAGTAAAYFDRIESTVVPALSGLLAAARAARVPVAHVRVASPMVAGTGDLSRRYRTLGFTCARDSDGSQFLPELAPIEGEAVVDKITSSAFVGTVLDTWLRSLQVDTIAVGGVVTNGCVESTVRHGADLGYGVWLVEDGCAALSPAEHDASLAQLDGNFARVVGADQACATLR